jgi:hypothetical protein
MLIDDVYNKLIADAIAGGATGWACYKGYAQPKPDKLVTIIETGGIDPINVMGGLDAGRPSFMVMVRGEAHDYTQVRAKIEAIGAALHFYTVNGRFMAISGSFVPLGEDENGRHSITLNFDTISIGNQ